MLDPMSIKEIPAQMEGDEPRKEYYVKYGAHFKVINLALNRFDDSFYNHVKNFVKYIDFEFKLILNYNRFKYKTREKMRKHYRENI